MFWKTTGAAHVELAPTLHQRFEQQAEVRPRAVAVVCDGLHLTYRELNREANRLARRLSEEGVSESRRVLVAVERSCDTAVALLAVLKAGGAFLTEDASLAWQRPDVVVSDGGSGFAGKDMKVVGIYEATGSDHNLGLLVTASQTACVSHDRSWSHSEALHDLERLRTQFELTLTDGVFHASPFTGDALIEFFLPWLVGGRLVLASPAEMQQPAWLREAHEGTNCRIVRLPLTDFAKAASI